MMTLQTHDCMHIVKGICIMQHFPECRSAWGPCILQVPMVKNMFFDMLIICEDGQLRTIIGAYKRVEPVVNSTHSEHFYKSV